MSAPSPASHDVQIEAVGGGVTAPAGFRSAGVAAGIKKVAGTLDLAVIAADAEATAAGIFTTNLAQAAPVIVSREHLRASNGRARAIVVNSGCANACTGDEGLRDARRMAAETAAALGCPAEQVLVSSTGVIGVNLNMSRVEPGIHAAVAALARGRGSDTARAIMTTDPFPKEHAVTVRSARGAFAVGGTAKGSGMIEPNMATMLAFLTTDAAVPPHLLHRAVVESARDTFNAITVDGECSTNDCVIVLASGASGVEIGEREYADFLAGLRAVSEPLAIGIVRGGEGATKLVGITVIDAVDEDDARRVARTIANSPLVKTAVHGADPNWGRIVAAAGRSGGRFDVSHASVRVGGVLLFDRGRPRDENAGEAGRYLEGHDIRVEMDLGTDGGGRATIWTCDLSAEYVRINGEYRT